MSIANNKITNIVKKAPKSPGVYFWRDRNKKILYIGRASNLRARLMQYLQKNIDIRIAEMVESADIVEYQSTENVLESIILEANLIKKHWPKYNIKEKDNKSFVYLIIPKTEFAKPTIIRGRDLQKFKSKNVYIFGPYQSYHLLNSALGLIRKIFPYSLCKISSQKPCFDYQIGLCPGACIDNISAKDYQKNINNIRQIFNGNSKNLVKRLSKTNPDKAISLKHIQDVSLIKNEIKLNQDTLSRIEAYDISHHAGKEAYGSMVVFEDGVTAKDEYRLFRIKDAKEADDERALLEVLLRRIKHKEWQMPEIFLIDGGRPQISFLEKKLEENNICLPLIGISKYGGDSLIYSKTIKKEQKIIIDSIKDILIKARDESHRFANFARKRAFSKKDFKY